MSLCLALCGCGGGGGSSVPIVTTPPIAVIPPVPTLTVSLTPSVTTPTSTDIESSTTFTVQATYTGDSTDPVVPNLTVDPALYSVEGPITQAGKVFTATLKSKSGLSAKSYQSNIGFRLCKEVACTTIYPGSTQALNLSLDVKIGDWTTRQRNSAHNGFVRVVLDATKFAKSWEWAPATSNGFEPVATRVGNVFVTQLNKDGSTVALSLDSVTGVEKWRYSFGVISHASGPALVGDLLAFSTMSTSSDNNPMAVVNATTGQFFRNFPFAAQWSTFAQPTPYQDTVIMSAGYFGNVVYGFDLKNAVQMWRANGSGGKTWDGQSPAVDSRYTYYYSGNLDVFDKSTGALVKTIADPFWQWNGYSYGGTPMISSENNVIAFSGNGMGTYSVPLPLVNYDVQAGIVRWRTASGYSVIPAAAKGVIYAASNQASELNAIEEATGKVLWAWPLPAGQQFVGNIIVTDNLVFLSTTSGIYAVDLEGTHQTKWTAATPGLIAITPEARLVVTPIRGQGNSTRISTYTLQ
jgi:PQQ-like domain